MKNKNITPEPELTRPLRIEKIGANGVEETIIASEQERSALATRFSLVELKKLEAKLNVLPASGAMNFTVHGRMQAEVVQRCVVTLEPLPTTLEQSIKVHFAAPELVTADVSERALDEDDMEPITNGIIDLGELVSQHLGLALDPYPRKAGLPPVEVAFDKTPVETNPFAKLALLKKKDGE